MSEPPIVPDEDPGPVILGWNDAPVSGDRVDVHQGPLIAGDPEGARVEVTGDGVHAYDATGTETARIQGEGGEFVGGSFRTSDALPGQVALSDTSFEDPLGSGIPGPGVGVTPRNPDGFTRFPGVGPSWGGMTVSGGRDATGRWSTVEASPTSSTLRALDEGGGGAGYISTAVGESTVRAYGPDGGSGEVRSTPTSSRLQTREAGGALASEVNASSTSVTARTYGANGDSGWMRARPGDAELAYVDPLNTYFSRLRATDTEASMFTRAGGANRYLTVDANGVWVETNVGGAQKSYNLEETASDSGWQPIAPAPGFTPLSEGFHVRQLGRMIYLRGAVTGNVTTGWVTIGTIPEGFRPSVRQVNSGASSTITNMMFQAGTNGELQVKGNNAGTGLNIYVNTILYPID